MSQPLLDCFNVLTMAASGLPSPLASAYLVWCWVTLVGACIGSFMNVVIYRVPAELSVVHPGSRCPRCLHAIRGRDNIPILSWLLLKGKCRDCGLPISKRYPMVEAATAAIFCALFGFEVVGNQGAVWITSSTGVSTVWQMIVVFSLHVMLSSTLFCAMMIAFDGKPIPGSLFFPLIVYRMLVLFTFPQVASGSNLFGLCASVAVGLAFSSIAMRIATSAVVKGNARGRGRAGMAIASRATWNLMGFSLATVMGWPAIFWLTFVLVIALAIHRFFLSGYRSLSAIAVVWGITLVVLFTWPFFGRETWTNLPGIAMFPAVPMNAESCFSSARDSSIVDLTQVQALRHPLTTGSIGDLPGMGAIEISE